MTNPKVKPVMKQINHRRQMLTEKARSHNRALFFQIVLISAVVLFVILAILAKTVAYFTFDVTITQAIQGFRASWFDGLMYTLSWIGFPPQTWIISVMIILFLALDGLKWEALVITASLIGITGVGLAIKALVERPRPSIDLVYVVKQLDDYAFPSGHVLYFTTFFGFLLFLVYSLFKKSWYRMALLALLAFMVALIGVSRIYEGQHWASDVLAAYLLGSIWLSLSILIYRYGKPRYFVSQLPPPFNP